MSEDIQRLPTVVKAATERVFLCDGDALAVCSRRIVQILDLLSADLPRLERVSAYANAHPLLRLSDTELEGISAPTAWSCST